MRLSHVLPFCAAILAAPVVVRAQSGGQPSPSVAAQAQVPYERGLVLYDQDHFEQAMEQFRASLAIFPSPNSRLYVARCLRELGRITEAAREYQLTIRRGEESARVEQRYALTRDAARQEYEALYPRIGRVTVALSERPPPEQTRVSINGTEVPTALLDGPVPVEPGRNEIVIDADGYQLGTSTANVEAGSETRMEITMQRGTRQRASGGGSGDNGLRTAGIVVMAVGGASLLGAAVFSLAADGQYNQLVRLCGNNTCVPSQRGMISTGRTFETLEYVTLGVGATALVVGGVMVLVSLQPRARPAPVQVGFDGHSVLLGGVF